MSTSSRPDPAGGCGMLIIGLVLGALATLLIAGLVIWLAG
jgi:hypothetical protein